MRVLLVGEGPSELGGALEAFTQKLLNREAEFVCDKVSSPKVHMHLRAGKGARNTKRALGWIRRAQREGFDALVLVIDQDGKPDREKALTCAQEDERLALPRALGVAIRSFDAWILADERALTKALGYKVSRQKAPESIQKPKAICTRLLDECREHDVGPRDMYAAVARCVDISALEERCPKGFAPFAERVRRL